LDVNADPLISVIIPTFNRLNLLSSTLDSVIQQTYSHWECIIVDDGSMDGIIELIEKYQNKDNRFKFISRDREPKGAPTCRNIGITRSLGEYVIFLDSDDVLRKDCLEIRSKVMRENPGNDYWVFRTAMFDKSPDHITGFWNLLHKDTNDLLRFLSQDPPWHTTGPVWKKSTMENLGGFDETAVCWQDWELHVRALLAGFPYYKHTDSNYDSLYRKNEGNDEPAINKKERDPAHLAFRLNLFDRVYVDTLTLNTDPSFNCAFAILYFRLFRELCQCKEYDMLEKFMRSVTGKKIFRKQELLLFHILKSNPGIPCLSILKSILIHKILMTVKKEWYPEISNLTFQK
jgi:glycosyltransferase involved in cell wall biosynthesis